MSDLDNPFEPVSFNLNELLEQISQLPGISHFEIDQIGSTLRLFGPPLRHLKVTGDFTINGARQNFILEITEIVDNKTHQATIRLYPPSSVAQLITQHLAPHLEALSKARISATYHGSYQAAQWNLNSPHLFNNTRVAETDTLSLFRELLEELQFVASLACRLSSEPLDNAKITHLLRSFTPSTR